MPWIASKKISGEVNASKDLIVTLSYQVAQINSEVAAIGNELTATKTEVLTTKNKMATKNEMEAFRTRMTSIMQIQLSNIQVSTSASPSPPESMGRTSEGYVARLTYMAGLQP